MAEILLGGDKDYYREFADDGNSIFGLWRDPNAGEAVSRWENGIRINNLQNFAQVDHHGKGIKIVWKGTPKIINGIEVELQNTSNK